MSDLGVYSAGFVVNILINGKMQQISCDGVISVPFNSEYSIRLQNKNSRRAVAKIFIDEENVSVDGVVVPAYSHINIECPVNSEFKFKFVSLQSGQAADAGKTKNFNGEKGLIRVEFKLEKESKQPLQFLPTRRNPWKKGGEYVPTWNSRDCGTETYSYSNSSGESGSVTRRSYEEKDEKTSGGILVNSDGCTVSGDKSNQSFYEVDIELGNEPAVVIKLVLRGVDTNNTKVLLPSVYCSCCGTHNLKINKSSYKFCPNCGHNFNLF